MILGSDAVLPTQGKQGQVSDSKAGQVAGKPGKYICRQGTKSCEITTI